MLRRLITKWFDRRLSLSDLDEAHDIGDTYRKLGILIGYLYSGDKVWVVSRSIRIPVVSGFKLSLVYVLVFYSGRLRSQLSDFGVEAGQVYSGTKSQLDNKKLDVEEVKGLYKGVCKLLALHSTGNPLSVSGNDSATAVFTGCFYSEYFDEHLLLILVGYRDTLKQSLVDSGIDINGPEFQVVTG